MLTRAQISLKTGESLITPKKPVKLQRGRKYQLNFHVNATPPPLLRAGFLFKPDYL
jgi:hypothetical protein